MNDKLQKVVIILAIVIFLGLAWMFRFDQIADDGRGFYLLDRWTGEIYLVHPSGYIQIPKPHQESE